MDTSCLKKMACSTLEVDISSNFILNRFQTVIRNKSGHTNPGIEAIWNDEHVRRQQVAESYNGDEQKLNAVTVREDVDASPCRIYTTIVSFLHP